MRRVALGLVVALVVGGCGTSDAEMVWCKANLRAVVTSATSLGLPTPGDQNSWEDWAMLVRYDTHAPNPWDAWTPAGDRANRDRACKAAYESR